MVKLHFSNTRKEKERESEAQRILPRERKCFKIERGKIIKASGANGRGGGPTHSIPAEQNTRPLFRGKPAIAGHNNWTDTTAHRGGHG